MAAISTSWTSGACEAAQACGAGERRALGARSPSPTTPAAACTRPTWATDGFGCTEEHYRITTLGCKPRGCDSDPPFDSTIGLGRVDGVKGDYFDASPASTTFASSTSSSAPAASPRSPWRAFAVTSASPRPRERATAPSTASPALARAPTCLLHAPHAAGLRCRGAGRRQKCARPDCVPQAARVRGRLSGPPRPTSEHSAVPRPGCTPGP